MALTATQIITARCPQLAQSSNLAIYLQLADEMTSDSFFGTNRSKAVALWACHLYTLDCRSNGEAGAIQSETEGRLSMSFAVQSSGKDLDQTHFGMELKGLIRSTSPAMRVTGDTNVTSL
jgi:DsbC/DsbD-like thiol-disulfide interchange protein